MSSRAKGKDNARARAAEMRAVQARLERRRRILAAAAALVVVVLVVGGLVLVKLTSGDGETTAASSKSTTTLPASVLKGITTVPTATSDKVGATGVTSVPISIKAPALTAGGKPKVLYVGAEYCPYCAAERWPVVVALSRFGTWSGLGAATSSSADVFPNTPTLSFHGATFTSDYLTFSGYETQTNKQVGGQYTPLDTVPSADQKIFDTYNKPPYIAGSTGGIPFIDIAGKYVSSGASFGPELLAGMTRAEIARAINDPSSKIGKAVLANANVLTAAICQATGAKPANVCGSSGVMAGAAALANGQKK
jgi:thiol-disulfide isomerase/thioredoxin